MKRNVRLILLRNYLIIGIFLNFFLTAVAMGSSADMSPEDYCLLAIQHLEQEVGHFKVLIDLAGQYKDAPEALAKQEGIKQEEFKRAAEGLCATYGITFNEFAVYMGRNGKVVNTYLKEHPEIRDTINTLSSELSSLLTTLESCKQ